MIDTHLHLIPGVDDGARDFTESLAMARAMSAAGVTAVICTPHGDEGVGPSPIEARRALDRLAEMLGEEGILIDLHLGYELTFNFAAAKEPELLRDYALGPSGRYVLLEAPYREWPSYAEDLVYRLRLNGLTPVIGHPERNPRLSRNPELLSALLRLGAVSQGTASSLRGLFGSGARRALLEMLSRGELDILATDAHFARPEVWRLNEAAAELEREFPEVDLDRLTRRNPLSIIEGRPVEPGAPLQRTRTLGGYLRRLLR